MYWRHHPQRIPQHIEGDAALERRFQPVYVDEPTVEQTIDILRGVRPLYEEHHKLPIADEALEAAARLSARYITDRYLPDKALTCLTRPRRGCGCTRCPTPPR